MERDSGWSEMVGVAGSQRKKVGRDVEGLPASCLGGPSVVLVQGRPILTGSLVGSVGVPDPRLGLRSAPPGLLRGHGLCACGCGPSCTTTDRCHTTEHPFPPMCRDPKRTATSAHLLLWLRGSFAIHQGLFSSKCTSEYVAQCNHVVTV